MSAPAAARARLVEQVQALGKIAFLIATRRSDAERRMAEAEAELNALGDLFTFAKSEIDRVRTQIDAHDRAQKGTPS